MTHLFPYDNVIAGTLVLIVGFGFHWLGQGLSVLNWSLATRLGLQEEGMPAEYKVYEHAIAVADVAVGWLYGLAGVGLVMGAPWGYKLACIPGAILVYHAIGFWMWTAHQTSAGYRFQTGRMPFRVVWTSANLVTGGLALAVAWQSL